MFPTKSARDWQRKAKNYESDFRSKEYIEIMAEHENGVRVSDLASKYCMS